MQLSICCCTPGSSADLIAMTYFRTLVCLSSVQGRTVFMSRHPMLARARFVYDYALYKFTLNSRSLPYRRRIGTAPADTAAAAEQ